MSRISGFETIGWTNPKPVRGPVRCDEWLQSVSGGRKLDDSGNCTVECNISRVAPGTHINQAFLLGQNPGATIQQIDNGIIPRLGRPMDESGTKDRVNAIASLEYKGDQLHAYVDSMYAHRVNDLTRVDLAWVGRNGAAIPVNTSYDTTDCLQGCTVTKGTYYNSQFFLEYRPFIEHLTYWGVNPGLEYQFSPMLRFDINGNYTKSTFHRELPSVLVITPANSGVTVNYDNTAGPIPMITTNVDLNNPANFGWPGGRVNIQDEKRRYHQPKGRVAASSGVTSTSICTRAPPTTSFSVGSRALITAKHGRTPFAATSQVCSCPHPTPSRRVRASTLLRPAPAIRTIPASARAILPVRQGRSTTRGRLYRRARSQASFGRGRTATSRLIGIVSDRRRATTSSMLPHLRAAARTRGASGGLLREKTWALFGEVNGDWQVDGNELLFNAGARWVKTWQRIGGMVSIPDPRNALMPNGGCPGTGNVNSGACYPNVVNFVTTDRTYTNWLPSASAAYHIGAHAVVRAAVSRTMTRPNPATMLPGLNFSSPSADVGSVGNPDLRPYISDNIDLGFEYYTGKEGYVGFAAFRKAVNGFTVNGSTTLPFHHWPSTV